MYSCQDLITELSNLLDDEVAVEVRTRLEEHLSVCGTCRVIYDSTRQTIRILTDAGSFDLPDSVAVRVRHKVMAEIRGRSH